MKHRVLINMLVIVAVSAGLVSYGVVTLFGNPFEKRRHVSTVLEDSAGIRTGFSASLNGVVVGTVSKVELVPKGVKITVALDRGTTVPGDVEARVVRASAVGEQRIDFVPTEGGTAPPLPDGATVKPAKDAVPPDVADVLTVVTRLVDALPTDDLNTVVHEGAAAVRGRSADLKALVSSLTTISDDTVASEKDLRRLLDAAPDVLDDFSAMSPSVKAALANTRDLTAILADDSGKLIDLLRSGADLSVVGDRIVLDNRTNLTCILSDLKDVTGFLQGRNLKNLERGLELNQNLFGAIDALSPTGHAADVGYGGGERNDQTWLRSRLLIPPGNPAASAYSPRRPDATPRYGEACSNVYGTGAGATRPSGSDGDGKGGGGADPRAVKASTAANGSGTGASGTDLGEQQPAALRRQASDGSRAKSSGVPLLVLGAGVVLAALALGPGTRHRRRRS